MVVIGLTGGIGTGKSEVARVLTGLGATWISVDELGHQAYRPHTETWCRVVEMFGERILCAGGEIDRRKLGAIVFSDAVALDKLNEIMYPTLFNLAKTEIMRREADGDQIIILEAALLIEADWTDLVDEVWVTVAPEKAVVSRLMTRSRLDYNGAISRVRAQLSDAQKVQYATVIIENGGSRKDLRKRVAEIWDERILSRKV